MIRKRLEEIAYSWVWMGPSGRKSRYFADMPDYGTVRWSFIVAWAFVLIHLTRVVRWDGLDADDCNLPLICRAGAEET